MVSRISIVLASLALLMVGVSPANAHTVLISSNLIPNSTITQFPKEITLTFGDPLLVLGKRLINSVQVINPKGKVITGATNRVKGAVLTNTFVLKNLVSGKYRVSFRVVAQDGHVVVGSFLFSVKNKIKR